MVGVGERWRAGLVLVVVLGLGLGGASCGSPSPQPKPALEPTGAVIEGEPGPASSGATGATAPHPGPAPSPSPVPPPSRSAITQPAPIDVPGTLVEVPYRLERRTTDPATAGFEAMAEATLGAPTGWARAGFRLVRRDSAPFVVVLAEAPVVDRLCLPYDTFGKYSCQNGPVVALNADRWRTATPEWTGTLDDYRRYLVGHEVGHLLGLHHPSTQCPAPGRPAPLMAQQSTELKGCLPNPWPLEAEVQDARRRPADLAPPYRG